LIQVARLDYLKDHLTAIRAMQRVAAANAHAQLLLVGDGPERSKIEAEIASRGLAHCVRLLGTRRDVPRLLQACDLCLLTSISEGIPLTLIEGMAAGLPVVSTDVGGVHEVVQPGVTGVLVPAGHDAQLAEAILLIASDPSLRTRMGERGAERARQEFSEGRMHERYRQLLEAMLPGRVGREAQGATP
jgi:glycosyltransferase involved in cell wall biosynthesis